MDISRFARQASTVLAAMLLSTVPASAYSDEAVQDAQAMLPKAIERASVGELTLGTVAMVRYHLLEMKFRAGQASHADLCRMAPPDLQAVVADLDDPAVTAERKKTWLQEIAVMNTSPAACDRAVATTAALLFNETEHVYSDSAVTEAEAAAQKAAELVRTGEATKADVAQAQYDLLEAQYGAKKITREAYCQAGVPQAQAVAREIDQEAMIGERTLQDQITAKRALYRLKALCRV